MGGRERTLVKIVVGHDCSYTPANTDRPYQWKLFVRAANGKKIEKNFINKIVVTLHSSYLDTATRTLREAPFETSDTAYGSFNPEFQIFFAFPGAKPFKICYDMQLLSLPNHHDEKEYTCEVKDCPPSFLEVYRKYNGDRKKKRESDESGKELPLFPPVLKKPKLVDDSSSARSSPKEPVKLSPKEVTKLSPTDKELKEKDGNKTSPKDKEDRHKDKELKEKDGNKTSPKDKEDRHKDKELKEKDGNKTSPKDKEDRHKDKDKDRKERKKEKKDKERDKDRHKDKKKDKHKDKDREKKRSKDRASTKTPDEMPPVDSPKPIKTVDSPKPSKTVDSPKPIKTVSLPPSLVPEPPIAPPSRPKVAPVKSEEKKKPVESDASSSMSISSPSSMGSPASNALSCGEIQRRISSLTNEDQIFKVACILISCPGSQLVMNKQSLLFDMDLSSAEPALIDRLSKALQ